MVLETTGNSLTRKSIYINDSKSLAFDTTPLSASSTCGLSLSGARTDSEPCEFSGWLTPSRRKDGAQRLCWSHRQSCLNFKSGKVATTYKIGVIHIQWGLYGFCRRNYIRYILDICRKMGHYEGKSKSNGPYTLLNIPLCAKEARTEKGSLKEHPLEWKPKGSMNCHTNHLTEWMLVKI